MRLFSKTLFESDCKKLAIRKHGQGVVIAFHDPDKGWHQFPIPTAEESSALGEALKDMVRAAPETAAHKYLVLGKAEGMILRACCFFNGASLVVLTPSEAGAEENWATSGTRGRTYQHDEAERMADALMGPSLRARYEAKARQKAADEERVARMLAEAEQKVRASLAAAEKARWKKIQTTAWDPRWKKRR